MCAFGVISTLTSCIALSTVCTYALYMHKYVCLYVHAYVSMFEQSEWLGNSDMIDMIEGSGWVR